MKEIYTDYFQKSKVFLYPLLKLKKGIDYVPIQTYVCWEHKYAIKDYKLLCVYHVKSSDKFVEFSNKYLKGNKYFYKYIDVGKNMHLFIFDFLPFKKDFDRFILGKYSQFSLDSKIIILDFFNSSDSMLNHIISFLSPDSAHEKYAIELDINIEEIKKIYEVCSIPNLTKETFQDNNVLLDCLLDNNSIYLEK
tara:strand:+ start:534 stop:1112 length:579 start_codon:yes stop_codon:yes gene_type:complete